jgi:hypothetical protein
LICRTSQRQAHVEASINICCSGYALCRRFFALERALSPIFQTCVSKPSDNEQVITKVVGDYIYCSGNFITEHSNGITAFATLIVAAFTVTLWASTNRQALLTKEALIANNRAFVFAPNYSTFWERDPQTSHYNWRLRPMLRNNGNTPTLNMTMFVECEIRNTPLPANYQFAADALNTASCMIPPHVDLSGGLVPRMPGAAITPQDIIDAQNGRKFIYLWGIVRYSDVFPGTRPHITRYCYMITVTGDPIKFVPNTPGQPPTPGTLAFNLIHHSEGNCIDEGCRLARLR